MRTKFETYFVAYYFPCKVDMIYVEVFAYYCDVIIVEQLVYYFILKEASPIYDITRYSSIKNVIFIPFLPGYVIRIKRFLIYPCLCK